MQRQEVWGRWLRAGATAGIMISATFAAAGGSQSVQARAVDVTPPVVTAVVSPAPNANGWHRANVRVRFVCRDTGGSGVAFCPAAVTVATEGEGQVVTGTGRDRAGNTATATVTLNIDKTAPVVTATRTPDAGPDGWVADAVTVSFSATDSLSGVVPDSVTSPVGFLTDRTNATARGRAVDRAGNVGTVALAGINIDMSAPRISVALSPEPSGGGWRNSPVTAHFTCRDTRSGVLTCPDDLVLESEGRAQVMSGTTVDRVGHTATISRTVSIDRTAPTVTSIFSRPPDINGWYTSPVLVRFKCADSLSGVRTCPAAVTISTEGPAQSLSGTATDRANNAATVQDSVNVDLSAPEVNLVSPQEGAEVTDDMVVVAGTTGDIASGVSVLSVNGVTVNLAADGTFAAPVALVDGPNTLTVTATDGVGRTTSRTVSLTRLAPPPPPVAVNLFADPTFETGVSGVTAQDASSTVSHSAINPLEGAHSLQVAITGYGNNVWWFYNFEGGRASRFFVSAHARSDVDSTSTLQFCAMVYFADGTTDLSCVPLSGEAGDKGVAAIDLPLDADRHLQSVSLRLYQEGGAPVTFSFDEAVANLDVVEAPPTGGGGNGGGNGGGGSDGGGAASCEVLPPGTSAYPGFTYQFPQQRPFISLAHYQATPQNAEAFARFRYWADQAVAGNPPYAYSGVSSVVMYRNTANPVYIDDAIARVEAFVTEAEAVMAAGGKPAIADDSYLDIDWYLEQLALAYDDGFDRLSEAQRQRWAALAEQSLFNLWHPSEATWGGVSYPWTGWSTCDPGNNYHFHFLRATMLWALASQNVAWFDFLQTEKFPPLVDYYAQLAGGGTREGTGYGTAIRSLFENYLIWKDSTGEDLSVLTPHAKETIDYWVHATVPTLDRFAPIGDQSRSSMPDLYDYHENLVHNAVVLAAGTPQAARGTWWLQHNSVDGVAHAFNLLGDLLPLPDAPTAPTELVYHATSAGALFARSSWQPDAAWLSFVAGKYDQSHAHQDQGSFTFFKGDWLAVTSNVWSDSGINQEVEYHNGLRFERADGTIINQTPSDTVASSLTYSSSGGQTLVNADLAAAYSRHQDEVQQWTRTLAFAGNSLVVSDTCTVADGITPIFQVHVPVAPVVLPDGSLQAGNLRINPLLGVTFTVDAMPAAHFSRGYRINFRSTVGCSFAIELWAQ